MSCVDQWVVSMEQQVDWVRGKIVLVLVVAAGTAELEEVVAYRLVDYGSMS